VQGVFAGDFEIVEPLAQGGMGAVYVARQISTGKRRALKIMQPDLVADAKARERFTLEARIASRIESEHVVEVVAAGIDDRTGTPWLAMELLEGQDLASLVRTRGRLPPAEVLDVFRQLGHALAAAHRQGIVHRDIKPENVFIARSKRVDAPQLVKVLDFGIAKLTQERQLGGSHRTAAVGTPLWMAPEQADSTQTPTPGADVWALGLMAFHALTGRYYWRSANEAEPRIPALFAEILTSPLEPASSRAASIGAGGLLPPAFDGWFGLCVSRDPKARFRDAAPAIAALEPVLSAGIQQRRDQMVAPTMAASGATPMPAPAPPLAAPLAQTPVMPASAIPQTAMMAARTPAWSPPAVVPSATPHAAPAPVAPAPTRTRSWILLGALFFLIGLVGVGGLGAAVIAVMAMDDTESATTVAAGPPPTTTTFAVDPPPTSVAIAPTPSIVPPATVADPAAAPTDPSATGVATTPTDPTTATSETTSDDASEGDGDADAADAPFVWADGHTVTLRGRCHYTTHEYTYTFTLTRSGPSVNGTGTARVSRVMSPAVDLAVGETFHMRFIGSRTDTTLQLVDDAGCQYDWHVRRSGGVSGSTSAGGRLSGRFATGR
jgi:serine/threonine-protein kinase